MTVMTANAAIAAPSTASATAPSNKSVFGLVRRWLAYRETVAELRQLSPRQLADIGIEADVEDVAWKLADR